MATDATDNFDPKQETALVALLNQPTVKAAAESIGIGERTLHRWLDEPAFAAAYRRARRQAFSQAIALTQRYAPMAVNTLASISNDKGVAPAARVAASSALLKFSRESIELDDMQGRIETLEGQFKDQKKDRGTP